MNHDYFVHRVLAAFAFENCDSLWWRVDGDYAPVTFMVQCSDVFWWGTADSEQINPEDLDALEAAFRDASAACKNGDVYAPELFCARKRGMRPQGAFYKGMNEALWPLFHACGAERETGLGNPQKPASAAGGAL